jgi:hypothetical protein
MIAPIAFERDLTWRALAFSSARFWKPSMKLSNALTPRPTKSWPTKSDH